MDHAIPNTTPSFVTKGLRFGFLGSDLGFSGCGAKMEKNGSSQITTVGERHAATPGKHKTWQLMQFFAGIA